MLRESLRLIIIACMPLITIVSDFLELRACATSDSSPAHHARVEASTANEDTDPVHPLVLGSLVEGEFSADPIHSYELQVDSGRYLRAVIDLVDADVALAFFEPGGAKITELRCYANRPTPLSVIAERSGTYRLELRSLQEYSARARYRLKIEEMRPATRQDRNRIAAKKAFAEAEQLRAEWRSESDLKAIERYEEALVNWKAAGEQREESTARRNIGEVYDLLGKPHKALQYYNRSLLISQKVNDSQGVGETLNSIGSVYLRLGKNQEGLEYCTRALNLSRENSNQRGEAQALNSLGEVYAGFGNMLKSIEFHNQALALWLELNDRRGQALSLLFLGHNYIDLCDTQRAVESFERALFLWRAMNDRRGQARTLIGLGHLYSRLGEKQQALNLYNQAAELTRLTDDAVYRASISNGIGFVYEELGEKQRALECYKQALRLLRGAGLRNDEAQALMTTADVHFTLGDNQIALNYYSQALSIFRALPNQRMESYALRNIGVVYESWGNKPKALGYYNQALALKRAGEDNRWEAYILNNIADVYNGSGEKQKALAHYKRALVLNRAAGDNFGETLTLCSIARVERDLGNLQEGLVQVEAALKIIESLRTKVVSRELRTSYFASERQRYDFYIDLLMRLHKEGPSQGHDTAALQASERSRARSLLESLAEARADIRQGVDPALLERERSLRQKLDDKAERQMRLTSENFKDDEPAALAKEIRDLTTEYEELQAQIRSKSPRYAALTQPQPLSLKEIQDQVLDDSTLLLEYALGDEGSYLWAVTKSGLTAHPLPQRAQIERLARQVHDLLVAPLPISGETAAQYRARLTKANSGYSQQASDLSQIVLGPVADQLENRRLLIVAEGALQYVPFGALPKPQAQGDTGARGRGDTGKLPDARLPLIVEHEIVSLPSASVLAVLRREIRERQAASRAVAVLADPVFESDDPRVVHDAGAVRDTRTVSDNGTRGRGDTRKSKGAGSRGRGALARFTQVSELQRALRDVGISRDGLSIPRLLSTRQEAEAIMSVAPMGAGMKATDFQASRATATGPELRQYRIVHFATHGLLNSEQPQLSGLVLSLVDERGKPQDGFLRLHDIYNLNLPADLVVLSACNTGLGREVRGEGLVGIVRGFMYAGAPRVVASLWKVDDEATAELMKRFYQRMLQGGMRPAAALRAAQVDMWQQKKWHSPYYWAAFVLQGEWK